MRSTITLEPDVRTLVERRMHERHESFKTVVNEALRAGLAGSAGRETPMPTFDMGELRVDLDKALALAGAMEDEELIRRLHARKQCCLSTPTSCCTRSTSAPLITRCRVSVARTSWSVRSRTWTTLRT
jgi:hypothetical protein